MENMPKVSVIIPTYNWEKYIENSLYSVLKQTYPNMEVLVVDDWSKDSTPAILKKIKQEFDTKDQIRIILEKYNKWISKNMNLWLHESNGKYIAILDQDDVRVDDDKILKQINFLEDHNDYWMVGTNVVINRMGELFHNKFPLNDELIRNVILWVSCFQHSSVMYHRDLGLDVWWYSENHKYTMDYKLFLDILMWSKAWNLPEATTCYNLHWDNFSKANCTKQSKELLDISWNHRGHFPKSTKALAFRIWNFLSSSVLWNNCLYEKLKLSVKNHYQN